MRICDICKSQMQVNDELSPMDIIVEVCNHYNVYITEVVSKRRNKHLVEIRYKIFDLIYSDVSNNYSLKSIGDLFNGKDHSTILYGIKRVKEQCEVYPEYKKDYQNLHKKIYGSLFFFRY